MSVVIQDRKGHPRPQLAKGRIWAKEEAQREEGLQQGCVEAFLSCHLTHANCGWWNQGMTGANKCAVWVRTVWVVRFNIMMQVTRGFYPDVCSDQGVSRGNLGVSDFRKNGIFIFTNLLTEMQYFLQLWMLTTNHSCYQQSFDFVTNRVTNIFTLQ